VKDFLDLRNEATHPKKGNVPNHMRNPILSQAIQWIDEVMLWRLGYSGKYLDRTGKFKLSREPRYDLSTRDSSW
jgi:hypothetical protein